MHIRTLQKNRYVNPLRLEFFFEETSLPKCTFPHLILLCRLRAVIHLPAMSTYILSQPNSDTDHGPTWLWCWRSLQELDRQLMAYLNGVVAHHNRKILRNKIVGHIMMAALEVIFSPFALDRTISSHKNEMNQHLPALPVDLQNNEKLRHTQAAMLNQTYHW